MATFVEILLSLITLFVLQTIAISEFNTLIIGLLALFAGELISNKILFINRMGIPSPILGGLLFAVANFFGEMVFNIRIEFATQLRDILILVFFASLGFAARFSALRAGGKPLFIIVLATILLLVVQNIISIGVAILSGAHPFYGLLAGSVSFVGGPGTALAWAKEGAVFGLEHSELVGLAAATFAVASGALVSGPVVSWIIKKHQHKNNSNLISDENDNNKGNESSGQFNLFGITCTLLLLATTVFFGMQFNLFLKSKDMMLPGFLCALLIAIIVTNVAGWSKIKLPIKLMDNSGDIALNVFLAISMMSLKLSALGSVIGPISIIVVLEVIVSVAIGYFVLFAALGKTYDASVTVGGFLGYGISSMPVAMATMEKITKRHGPSPKAILIITLAGAFFVDLINAMVVKGFFAAIQVYVK